MNLVIKLEINLNWTNNEVNSSLRWKANIQNIQLECLLHTESRRSGRRDDRKLAAQNGHSQ